MASADPLLVFCFDQLFGIFAKSRPTSMTSSRSNRQIASNPPGSVYCSISASTGSAPEIRLSETAQKPLPQCRRPKGQSSGLVRPSWACQEYRHPGFAPNSQQLFNFSNTSVEHGAAISPHFPQARPRIRSRLGLSGLPVGATLEYEVGP